MKKPLCMLLLAALGLSACSQPQELAENYDLIPQPVEMKTLPGAFVLKASSKIIVEDPQALPVARMLAEQLSRVTGKNYVAKEGKAPSSNAIVFSAYTGADLGAEGYLLQANPKSVVIQAAEAAGFFYAMQSLMQLMPPAVYAREVVPETQWYVSAAEIRDIPRFAYRGMHLDVCRHFFPVEFVKKYIDLLSMQKMNRFHWHLTEDQGWRIEIKSHPKLTEIGSQRAQTLKGAYKRPFEFDGIPHGGFYTQEEVKEVVAYAAERHITVIPEIEMPGHALAALAAYPELGCTGGPYEVTGLWGVFDDVFCAGNEATFALLEDVLAEVCELFPSEYIHIGGDECPKTHWNTCPACKARMKAEGLKDAHELQSWFIQRIEKFLNGKGRQIIGWDEILEGGLAPNATVMSWRGVNGGIAAAKAGHKAIMTPNSYCYLDYYQAQDKTQEPLAIGGFLPLDKVYSYEPIPDTFTEEEASYIWGVQGNLWTEYIPDTKQVEYMAYPRSNALAEIGWSPRASKDWDYYLARLQTQFKRWEYYGVNYARHFLK
jgi:N-acetyl-beta-hexosaminidase